MPIEKFNDLIGNRACDLPACSILPQPTAIPRALYNLLLLLLAIKLFVFQVTTCKFLKCFSTLSIHLILGLWQISMWKQASRETHHTPWYRISCKIERLWFRRLAAGFSPVGPGFDPSQVKWDLWGQNGTRVGFLCVLLFPLQFSFRQQIHIHYLFSYWQYIVWYWQHR
jgi:hypothetical protein